MAQRVRTRRLGRVNNSPRYTPIGDTYVRPSTGPSDLQHLAQALGVAHKGLNSLYEQHEEEKAQEQKDDIEFAQAVEKRYRANQALKLKNNVSAVQRDLTKKYMEDESLQNASVEELSGWIDEQTSGLVDKVNDPRMKESYGSSLLQVRDGLLDTHNENLLKRQKQDAMEEFGVSVTDALDSDPANFASHAENLRNFAITNLDLSKQEADGVLVEAAVNKARDPNSPSLAGIEYLRNKKHPAGGSIADIPEFRRRLDAAEAAYNAEMRRRQAEAEAAAKAEADATSWRVRAAMGDQADKGLLTPEEIDRGVAGGYLTESQAVSLYDRNQDRIGEIQQRDELIGAIRNGDVGVYHSSDVPKKVREEAWSEFSRQALDANEGDVGAAAEQVLTESSKLGVMPKPYKAALNNATPSNPEAFEEAYQIFQATQRTDPNLIGKEVSPRQRELFNFYERNLERGDSSEQALERVKNLTENLGDKDKFITREQRENVRDRVMDVADDAEWFGEAKNQDYILSELTQFASDRFAEGSYVNYDDAVEVAVRDFQQSHQMLNGMMIKADYPVPKPIKEHLPEVVAVYKREFLQGTPDENADITFLPDPRLPDDMLRPYRLEGNSAFPIMGKPAVSKKKILEEAIKAEAADARKRQAEQTKKATDAAVERFRELEGMRDADGNFPSRDAFTIGEGALKGEYERLKKRLNESGVDLNNYSVEPKGSNTGVHPLQQQPWRNE